MSKFMFNENMYGPKVKFISEEAHMDMPEYYPAVGTVGTVVKVYDEYCECYGWKVQWPKGSTSGNDCWFCEESDVELIEEVDKQMTNEEIWEMLQPKLLKNYIFPNEVCEAVDMAYRIGYFRAMKGRPFKIGEKKKKKCLDMLVEDDE